MRFLIGRCFTAAASILYLQTSVFAGVENQDMVDKLLSGARSRFTALQTLDMGITCQYRYPEKNISRTINGHLQTSGDRVRLDYDADIFDYGDQHEVLGVIKRSAMTSYDGQRTSVMSIDESIFTIWGGNHVPEYRLLFQGAYMFGERVDEWLAGLQVEYKGKSVDNATPGQLYLARRPSDDKGRERTFEIRALDDKGFVITSCRVLDGYGRVLAEQTADNFKELAPGVWAAQEVTSKDMTLDDPPKVDRQRTVKLSFDHVNEPMDDSIFQLSPPLNYTIRDNIVGITIRPGDTGVIDFRRDAPTPPLNARPTTNVAESRPVTQVAERPTGTRRAPAASDSLAEVGKSAIAGSVRQWVVGCGLAAVVACVALILLIKSRHRT